MNDTMNDTIVDQALFPPATTSARPALSVEDLLRPKNPAEGLLGSEDWRVIADRLRLSPRERSVATLIFNGKTRSQIARALECADGTVRVYIDRVFLKFNVVDRLGLALRVMRVHQAIAGARVRTPASHKAATCRTA